jgi:RNA polymerase sigma factor (sigma-70 family)
MATRLGFSGNHPRRGPVAVIFKKGSAMNAKTIAKLLRFQQTGLGFDDFWADIDAHVNHVGCGRLRRHLVRGWKTRDDLAAVDEVVQRVRKAIFEGAGPGGKGQFNPSLGRGGVDGLRAWLFRIVQTHTASYCREYRADGRRKIKRSTFTDLELNDRPGVDSVLQDPLKVDPDRFELVEIVNDCLRSLPQPQQDLFHVRFGEGLSHREAAKRLGVTAPTVCRHEAKLKQAVIHWFRDRGIDGAGLIA